MSVRSNVSGAPTTSSAPHHLDFAAAMEVAAALPDAQVAHADATTASRVTRCLTLRDADTEPATVEIAELAAHLHTDGAFEKLVSAEAPDERRAAEFWSVSAQTLPSRARGMALTLAGLHHCVAGDDEAGRQALDAARDSAPALMAAPILLDAITNEQSPEDLRGMLADALNPVIHNVLAPMSLGSRVGSVDLPVADSVTPDVGASAEPAATLDI